MRACLAMGLICKKVRLAEIAECEPIRIRWWYGWGIHLTPYGWLYNVSGLDAVAITLRDGRKFALGTDDPARTGRGDPAFQFRRIASELPRQFAEPMQRDRGLRVIDFVAATKSSDSNSLKASSLDRTHDSVLLL